MMKCPECGQNNPQNPRYCTRCGHQLSMSVGSPPAAPVDRGQPRKTQAEDGVFGAPSPRMASESTPPRSAGPAPKNATKLEENDATEARVVGCMVAYTETGQSHAFVLRAGRNRLGRGRDNDVSLFFEGRASNSHATLIWRAGNAAVKDEGSTNGTFINGEDIGIGQVMPVRSGDTLRIGSTEFLVFLVDPARAAQLWPKSPWGK
jgi:hypothetical protein